MASHASFSLSIINIVTALILSVAPLVFGDDTCYFPDGSVATENVPCSSDRYAACCGTTDLCLSNGLCLNAGHQPYVLSRGACTDPNWKSENCPEFCQNVTTNGGSSIINLSFINNISTYCCGTPVSDGDKIACLDGNSFLIQSGSIVVGHAALANVSSLNSQAKTDTNTSTSASASNCTVSTLAKSANTAKASSSHDAAIGAGVGVPLGVIALAAICWALWERRTRQRSIAVGTINTMVTNQQIYTPPQEVKDNQRAELSASHLVHEM